MIEQATQNLEAIVATKKIPASSTLSSGLYMLKRFFQSLGDGKEYYEAEYCKSCDSFLDGSYDKKLVCPTC